ncbi:FtsK/SpoIIIE domain-containing protein [Pseudonocardia sp. CA-107938]|uniref:FtsK/SpoIIIE domain-containing protein n=1 Tax=Pseudonocardia sp. CA-107938 TaxID=3240021 RepID=UPI003D8F4E00
MRGRNRRQQEIAAAFDNLCAAVGRALGAAEGAQDAAEHARMSALAELWLRDSGLSAARADPAMARLLAPGHRRLADVVKRVAADEDAVLGTWLAHGPRELDEIVADAAPGSAGRPPAEWLGQFGKADALGTVPGLWRIGTGRIGGSGTPFDVAVPLLDEGHVRISADPDRRREAEALVETLLMRVLSHFRPGLVAVHVWDTGQLAGALPGLYPLTRTELLTVHHPGRLAPLLDQLSDRIRRIHTRLLVDGYPSLQALGAATGVRHEPWIVAVLMGDGRALPDEEYAQLQRIARGGPACGVHLVLVDVPTQANPGTETVHLRGGTTRTSMTGEHVAVELDPALPARDVSAACQVISEEHERWRHRVSAFRDLLPPDQHDWGTASSKAGLRAPVGFADVLPVDLALADASPHALIGGPSGTGKTNLLLTMIGSLAARYGPDELEFYLLDFKEGVSFAQFAPGRKDRTWLPHARLVGVNINTDREFGLALLQFLADEMRRRSEVAKAHEVTKLEELREADPDGRWPRIVAVIDEFQYLFNERDAVTRAALQLLEDVARRGRSQGIHLVLASQDVSGIEAFWGRSAIFEQFVLRIALPRARKVLAELNDVALDLPRWHAVINHESGIRPGNEIVRIPDATGRGSVDEVQRVLHAAYGAGRPEPRLFDGSRSPQVGDLLADLPAGDVPQALVGQYIDVEGSPAAAPLPDAPGRNLGVLGTDPRDALRVVGAATASVLRGRAPGSLDLIVAPLVDPSSADRLVEDAAGHAVEVVELAGIADRIAALAASVTDRQQGAERRTTFVVLHGADAADALLGRSGTEALQRVLRFGPEVGIHVIGWWRSVARLRSLLSLGASPDDLGAWVALDVQGNDLGTLAPTFGVDWSSRPGRGLFFDRSQHSAPRVVIVPELP